MIPKLKIASFVLKRLEKVKEQCSGCLFGVMYDGTLLILGFNIESAAGQFSYKKIHYKFPAEIDLCGLVKFGNLENNERGLDKILLDVDITDNPILLECPLGRVDDLKASILIHGKEQNMPYEIMSEQELFKDFCFTRIRCDFHVLTEENISKIEKDMQYLRKNLAAGILVFPIKNSNICLTGASAGCDSKTNIADILNIISSSSDIGKGKKPQKQYVYSDFDIIAVDVLQNKSKDKDKLEKLKAMRMHIVRNDKSIRIPLHVDAMAMLFKRTKVASLYAILIESICRCLRLIEQTLVERMTMEQSLTTCHIYHFAVPEIGHYVTCAYPDDMSETDSAVVGKRKRLHHLFNLPITRPYFRRANKCMFRDELPTSPLINTHVGARPSGVKDGKQYLVYGKYKYYHYMQQNFDDNGWGCAYRSLQTLSSWFQLQGYTEQPPPTHAEIQKYLVKTGDKPSSFTGSRQWIGSTEVSMCLSGLLNIDSRILHVSSGSELKYKGSELAMHFESQGTPIMIGGGVLAHTIIGVDFNNESGDIKFLILDPHYTGDDDLSTIQAKGWCGWKGPEFWDKKSYYNLCMPIKPVMY